MNDESFRRWTYKMKRVACDQCQLRSYADRNGVYVFRRDNFPPVDGIPVGSGAISKNNLHAPAYIFQRPEERIAMAGEHDGSQAARNGRAVYMPDAAEQAAGFDAGCNRRREFQSRNLDASDYLPRLFLPGVWRETGLRDREE